MPKKNKNLEWQVQMGADEAIEATPQDNFAKAKKNKNLAKNEVSATSPTPAKTLPQTTQKPGLSSPSSAINHTRNISDSCKTIDELKNAVLGFNDLSIAKTATNTVFADGATNSKIMFIGEAPGAEEDAQGIPFCGASGQLLDQMLSCIGLFRDKNFYISNTIFWRPPGNRRPTPEELAICLPFVEKHIALIKPELIVLVGGTAVSALIDSKEGITKMRGRFFEYNNQYLGCPIKTTAIFHPSYLLRSPGQKRIAWKDLLAIQEHLDMEKQHVD